MRQDCFPELVNRAIYTGERITISRRGKDVAFIAAIKDLRILERLSQEQDRQDTETEPLRKLGD